MVTPIVSNTYEGPSHAALDLFRPALNFPFRLVPLLPCSPLPLFLFPRRLADGAKEINIAGVPIKVAAKIETIYGYSSHKDSDHLVEFVATAQASLKQVFVVMGEPKASLFLAQRLRDTLGVNALYPEREKTYDL